LKVHRTSLQRLINREVAAAEIDAASSFIAAVSPDDMTELDLEDSTAGQVLAQLDQFAVHKRFFRGELPKKASQFNGARSQILCRQSIFMRRSTAGAGKWTT
jgi:hypothetical protein